MNWKTLALGFAMTGLATACGTSPMTTDSGTGNGSDSGPGESHTYVIGAIDTEPSADGVHVYGFNLDDMVDGPAGSCQDAADFTSTVTGTTGVDNQLGGTLVGVLDGVLGGDGVNGAIATQISAGKVLLMLDVSGINSFTNDSAIRVHAVLGTVSPAGAACAAHADMASCMADTANMCSFAAAASGGGGTCSTSVAPMPSAACAAHTDQAGCMGDSVAACTWGMTASTCTGIAANQMFSILTDLGTVDGTITAGQLSATTDSLPLSFVAMGHNVTLTLHTVRFGGHITATGITGGEFGAQILISELMQTVMNLGFSIDITSLVTPDLMPNADGSVCAALSAGMGFTAIPATLTTH